MVQKSDEEKKAALEKKRDQIDAELKAITARSTATRLKHETRKKIVLGSLLLEVGRTPGDDLNWLLGILRAANPRAQDKAIVAALVKELETDNTKGSVPV